MKLEFVTQYFVSDENVIAQAETVCTYIYIYIGSSTSQHSEIDELLLEK